MVKFIFLVFLFLGLHSYSQTQQQEIIYFGVGYGVSSLTILTCEKYDVKRPFIVGFCTGVVLGVTKELYDDYFVKGKMDGVSMLATVAGSGLACVTLKIPIRGTVKK